MTALTGTVVYAAKNGESGQQYAGLGKYTLGGALANADTITWTNLLPKGKFKVLGFKFWGPEIDTNATPTATFTIGDGTDADGYLTTKGGAVGLQNSLADQLSYEGDGALIGTTQEGRNVVLTVTAAVATGATSGTIWVQPIIEGL